MTPPRANGGRLAGKVALVTGGASGMGAAHVRALTAAGASVAIADIATDPASRLADELNTAGATTAAHELDVSDPWAWHRVVEAVTGQWGAVDVLVNNAGVQVRSTGVDATDREWDMVTRVNQLGVFLGMQAVIPGMVKRGGGSIINVASVAALVAMRGSIPYQGSKAAVLGLTRGAAVTYGRDNVRVNAICPGLVITGMTQSASTENVEVMKAQIPLGRDGLPEEIAQVVVFLASDESSYITGVALPVDGGLVVV